MPSSDGVKSRPFRDQRQVVEAVTYMFRTGIAWRDLPASFGQTVWKRHHRFSTDGTWDKIHARLLAEADAGGEIDWMVSVDSTIGPGRPRTRPTAVLGDKAYSSRAIRAELRARRIKAVIPQPADLIGTANAVAQEEVHHLPSTPRPTEAGTSSNAPSTAP